MHRAIRYGTIIGALLLSAACENQSEPPAESSFVPRPKEITTEEAAPRMVTRVHGYAFDPEAFFLSIATCQNCPIPPFLLDNSPLFLRSVVIGAPVTLVDIATGQPAQIQPAVSSTSGTYTLDGVPSREEPPFVPLTPGGQGALAPIPFPPVPVPPANYLPTVTARPVYTGYPGCFAIEAAAMSDNGILEAVAKYLTMAESTPTTVADFINPAKYTNVMVFWYFIPGFPFLRAPADGTTVEASSGRVINVIWAPPGALPPALEAMKSTRGFVVIPGAPTSALGISVVLLPAGGPPPPYVLYTMKDTVTDTVKQRPWRLPLIALPPSPGVITYAGLQVDYGSSQSAKYLTPAACIPLTRYE